jgi:hypothetical protein
MFSQGMLRTARIFASSSCWVAVLPRVRWTYAISVETSLVDSRRAADLPMFASDTDIFGVAILRVVALRGVSFAFVAGMDMFLCRTGDISAGSSDRGDTPRTGERDR